MLPLLLMLSTDTARKLKPKKDEAGEKAQENDDSVEDYVPKLSVRS